jgi:hypothetical protein
MLCILAKTFVESVYLGLIKGVAVASLFMPVFKVVHESQ